MRHHVINAYQCVIYDNHVDMFSWSLNVSKRKVGFLIYLKDYLYLKQKQVEPLSTNPTKWSNTLKQKFVGKLPTNCLSVFDHFVGLVLKGLNVL